MQYKKGFISVLCLVFLAISGCSSVPMASSTQDNQAKLFHTHPEKSNLYIFRSDKEGSSIKMKLDVDGKYVATNIGQTYIKLVVDPGKHVIVSHADNNYRLVLATLKNKNYFIYQDVKVGKVTTRTKLSHVRENVGKQGVINSVMISSVAFSPALSMR
ncbi:MAG: hypothetical protein DIZ80_05170 [endosymbiont of Galathealinum brachiosum]|uniref:DUF2846 domain-containing protein n=1 Tax=endosymbiont of Galathealinum brachiosum TaxID=2200906 RepID=A0A370DKL5_9GAMM|nr:MAG: hypothetical protein DIZ80_05170 [endosymbiont of Galathealinum brachiosum]